MTNLSNKRGDRVNCETPSLILDLSHLRETADDSGERGDIRAFAGCVGNTSI